MDDRLWQGGLTKEHDLMFPACPGDPEMRESTSFWLFEENGAFALPRLGIEAEAASWDQRRVQFNMAFPDGRVLGGAGMGAAHSPQGSDGRPVILGAGALSTRCIEPFRCWALTYDGEALDGDYRQQIASKLVGAPPMPVRLNIQLEMAAPAWVHDYTPARLAAMTPAERAEAQYMGLGYRIEQLCRGEGELTLDGETRIFRCLGSRIHRQSVRPLAGFRGHCWQSAVFPDGRAFGFITYPPAEDGTLPFNDGFVWTGGRWLPAKSRNTAWLGDIRFAGDRVPVSLETAAGTFTITGRTIMSTFRVGNPDIGGLDLQQAAVAYDWDGQRAIGMIERSSHESLTRVVD